MYDSFDSTFDSAVGHIFILIILWWNAIHSEILDRDTKTKMARWRDDFSVARATGLSVFV
jgi:hypothetical protein